MFLTRTISGIVLTILAFGAIWAGDWVLLLALLAVSTVGFLELTKAMDVNTKKKSLNAYEIVGLAGIVIYDAVLYLCVSDRMLEHEMDLLFPLLIAVMLLVLMLLMAIYVFTFPKAKCDVPVRTYFAYIYAPVLLSFIWLIREWYDGFYLVWLVFISSWISDTCAYLVGRTFGKHKLAPVLSPKKSIEGAVGGVLGAALVGFVYGLALEKADIILTEGQRIFFMAVGGVGSVISQIGDLAASGIKRDHEIKDYGKLIPGHGGVMDRFDSVIVTAPIIYFMCMMFLG